MDIRLRIEEIVSSHPVVLFMKGTRSAPRCGFSSRVVDVLDELLEDYLTVDVLADEAIREGIKEYGQWPTIPQLYVRGKLVGGADIVAEMMRAGELAPMLGVEGPIETEIPEVHVSDAAVAAFRQYAGVSKPDVRLAIDRAFDAELDIEAPREDDVVIDLVTLRLSMDRASARRADGVSIDFVSGPGATGFRITNPAAPPKVKSMSVEQLDQMRRAGKPHLLVDVRTPEERAIAEIEGSELLDEDLRAKLADLDRATTLVLYCHHGVRSRAAAEHCVRMGFRDVWNVEGGIEAWSTRVDPKVARY
ncbi:Grx4 family monothiol glutaredoxin [Sandaracinus amylolyticus]|uniref:Glutaredoxin-related protein n=1 Tax=Sandaracinus amylolyticus TaxID=927083 RepID=A0A0F6W876_9BACT|nr:Grx4 family monothiol glutaredoxin [Sandaracinus amylolyticus]AKF09981.1 Glutaredoxin-related protein [Sandaracinus amylolyticus]